MERPPFPQRIQVQVLVFLAQDFFDLGWREGQGVRLEASVCLDAGVHGPVLAPGKVPAREQVADDEQVHVGGAAGIAACRGAEKDDFFNAVCRTLQHGRQQLMHSPVDPGGTLPMPVCLDGAVEIAGGLAEVWSRERHGLPPWCD